MEPVQQGRVIRIAHRDVKSLFSVFHLERTEDRRVICAVGTLLELREGDQLKLEGVWQSHPRFGPQLKVSRAERILPRDSAGIATYLSGGLFPGIGPALAERIVKRFGEATLEILSQDPSRVQEVPGIGPKKRTRIVKALEENLRIQNLALFLQSHGITLYVTKKVYERYGDDALEIIKRNPYRVAEEVSGIGFLRADDMARKLGLPPDAPERIRAAVRYQLKDRCEAAGHTFLPMGLLTMLSLDFLNRPGVDGSPVNPVPPATVHEHIYRLVADGLLYMDSGDAIYMRDAYRAEVELADRIAIHKKWWLPPTVDLAPVIAQVEDELKITYAPEQREAILAAITNSVSVITGGPGTGKSTVIKGVIAVLRQVLPHAEIRLGAPTGRAAKRMMEITNMEAQTIHRLLKYSPDTGKFDPDEGEPLSGDLVVLDEFSMADLYLANAVFAAVEKGVRVLIVGDKDQLASVGIGNVLGDLIASEEVPVVRLQVVYRQKDAEGQRRLNRIKENAHRILSGQMILLDETPEFGFVPLEKTEDVMRYIKEKASSLQAAGHSLEDISILAPKRKGELGVEALNAVLQSVLNPARGQAEIKHGRTLFRAGDKVMNTRNVYEKGTYNGDIGIVKSIHLADAEAEEEAEDQVVITYDGVDVFYTKHELDPVVLAYCTTVHKAQGSEFQGTLILPMVSEYGIMLYRNLFYTSLTRGKTRVEVVGHERAVRRAITSIGNQQRFSRLAQRIQLAA